MTDKHTNNGQQITPEDVLYQQLLERNRELHLLVESANAVSSSLELGHVLNAIARQMMRALEAHWCVIYRLSQPDEQLIRLAEYRHAFYPTDQSHMIDLEKAPFHKAALKGGKPLTLNQPKYGGNTLTAQHLNEAGLSRLILLPLQIEGDPVGLAEIASLRTLQPRTPQESGNLLYTALRLAKELAALSGQPPEDADQFFEHARTLARHSNADWITIYTLSSVNAGLLKRVLAYGHNVWPEFEGPPLALDNLPTLRIVLEERRVTVLHSDNLQFPHEKVLFKESGPGQVLIIPLTFNLNSIGLVLLNDLNARRSFTEREMVLALTMANQAATGLENARLVSALQDSLERQRAMQSHLVRAARLSALGELSAMVAHQVNNPLTTILADAEILADDLTPGTLHYESAQAIMRAGQRARSVIQRMLNMARSDETPRKIDCNQTIQDALVMVGGHLKKNQITLDLDLQQQLPPIQGIPGQCEDIWINLIMNAIDAIRTAKPENGIIRITSRIDNNNNVIAVTVEDNGAGIREEDSQYLFDPFFTTKPQGKGTGLGLYICRQIVDDHDGHIFVTSKPGANTVAKVLLPAL